MWGQSIIVRLIKSKEVIILWKLEKKTKILKFFYEVIKNIFTKISKKPKYSNKTKISLSKINKIFLS